MLKFWRDVSALTLGLTFAYCICRVIGTVLSLLVYILFG